MGVARHNAPWPRAPGRVQSVRGWGGGRAGTTHPGAVLLAGLHDRLHDPPDPCSPVARRRPRALVPAACVGDRRRPRVLRSARRQRRARPARPGPSGSRQSTPPLSIYTPAVVKPAGPTIVVKTGRTARSAARASGERRSTPAVGARKRSESSAHSSRNERIVSSVCGPAAGLWVQYRGGHVGSVLRRARGFKSREELGRGCPGRGARLLTVNNHFSTNRCVF